MQSITLSQGQPVTIEHLAAKVKAMREAQNHYFDTRTNSALRKARSLEQQVDQLLTQIELPKPSSTIQPSFL